MLWQVLSFLLAAANENAKPVAGFIHSSRVDNVVEEILFIHGFFQ